MTGSIGTISTGATTVWRTGTISRAVSARQITSSLRGHRQPVRFWNSESACPRASPSSARRVCSAGVKGLAHLARLPQGRPEAAKRVLAMMAQHDFEGFGFCSNVGACEAECPKSISLDTIALMNREFTAASFTSIPEQAEAGGA